MEIGPGIGFLSQFLGRAHRVSAVELDRDAVEHLSELNLPNLELHHQDFLAYSLDQHQPGLKVVGNVPYQITTPILVYLFGEIGIPRSWFSRIERVILTVQYEVAQRFCAKPGTAEYSQITLLSNYFAKAEMIAKVPADSFHPAPKVNSAIVKFTPLAEPPVTCNNPRLLRQLIRAGFSGRRKMLKSNLGFLKVPSSAVDAIFKEMKLDPQTRAEKLSLAQFAQLCDSLEAVRDQS